MDREALGWWERLSIFWFLLPAAFPKLLDSSSSILRCFLINVPYLLQFVSDVFYPILSQADQREDAGLVRLFLSDMPERIPRICPDLSNQKFQMECFKWKERHVKEWEEKNRKLCWKVYVNLTQALRVSWEKGRSIEKMPPYDQAVGKLAGYFLN